MKRPWNYFSVFIFSAFLGPGAGYLIAWQNLKRMGKLEDAKKFSIFGGLILFVMLAVFSFLPDDGTKILGEVVGIAFPIWLYYAHQKQWQLNNPNQAKFSWSILGWALLGLLLVILAVVLLTLILPNKGV